ncbi:BnaC07g47980D [Brassica napus]|nr:BnaC07g47980D [Brassica napus]
MEDSLVDRSQNSPQPGNHPMPALGIKIHATCKKNYLKSLGEQCKAGEWKTLYNFQVSATGKHYRPTEHMYKITFIN